MTKPAPDDFMAQEAILRDHKGHDGSKPELDGPFQPVRITVDAGDECCFLARNAKGEWIGITSSAYDQPQMLNHLEVFGVLCAIINDGIIE
jgi:hypothetical protein